MEKKRTETTEAKLPRLKVKCLPPDSIRYDYEMMTIIHQERDFNLYKARNVATSMIYLLVEAEVRGVADFNEIEKRIQSIDKMAHHHLIALKFYTYELCVDNRQSYWKYWLGYEFHTLDLPAIIKHRREHDIMQRFSEADLIAFLKDMLSLFAFLHLFNFDHRPLNPYHFVMTQNATIKYDGINLGKFNFLHKNETSTPKEFLSPELLENYKKIDPNKAEVFSLGLILLYTATLKKVDDLNSSSELTKQRVDSLTDNYSQKFIKFLKTMLEFNVAKRPTFAELYMSYKKEFEILDRRSSRDERKDSGASGVSGVTGITGMITEAMSFFSGEQFTERNEKAIKIDYDPKGSVYKMFHIFVPQTKRMLKFPIVDLKSIYMEEINLNINFYIPLGHRSCYTKSGKIYLIGGVTQRFGVDTYLFNRDDCRLISQGKMLTAIERLNFGICTIDKLIYVAGGHDSKGRISNTSEVYDTERNTWTMLPNMKSRVFNSLLCSFNGEFLYRIGGTTDNNALCTEIEKFSIKNSKWMAVQYKVNPLAKLLLLELSIGMQINQNQIFVFGGFNSNLQHQSQTFLCNVNNQLRDSYKGEIREEIVKVNEHRPKNKFSSFFYPDQITIIQNHVIALQDDKNQYKAVAIDEQGHWKVIQCFDKKQQDRASRVFTEQ